MKRALWSPLLWKAGSAAPSMTPSLLCPQNTGARSNANWSHKIMEKNWKNKWVVIFFFFLLRWKKKRKRNKWLRGTSAGESRCRAHSPFPGRRLVAVRAGAGNTRAEAGGLGLFFCFVGWGFFRGRPNSLGLLLPSIMLHAFAAGEKEMSSLWKQRREKEILLMR